MYPKYPHQESEFLEYGEEHISDTAEFAYPIGPAAPDVLLIAGVTLVMGLFLLGFLSQLADVFFNFSALQTTPGRISENQTEIDSNEVKTQNSDHGNLKCEISAQYPAKITRWCNIITQYAHKHNLDPDLIAALVWLESGGNELAYSHSGAVGLMQVMPRDGLAASFMCANGPCFRDRPSSDELRDPEFNIAFGTRFLAGLVKRNGNLRDALKSYGPMDAGYTYADKVLNIFNRYNHD